MDVSHLLDTLNEAQRQAVASPLAPALVLAGAGSGKTRVLVHRVAWLVQVEGVSPNGILAVTFTNKAAGEMRSRIESLLRISGVTMWIGTFHGLAHRLLRMHWREAGLPQNFQILDSEDQTRVLRKVLKTLDLDEARWVPREIQWFINAQKDEGLRPKHLADNGDATRRQLIRIYQAYEEACQRAGVVDFAELLLRAYEIWRDNPSLLQHYRQRFRHVLIDEFQDTNAIQYKWLTLLAGPTGLPFAVGDDDQSIYRWRGARVENLNQFRRDFPAAALYKLEQNYRSSGTISQGRERTDRQQCGPPRQDAVDERRGRRAHPALCGVQRARRGRFRRQSDSRVGRAGRPATRHRDPVPLERAIAGIRGGVLERAAAVQGLWRPAILRACGNQGCARLPAIDLEPRRRHLVRTRRESAHARNRREDARYAARLCARACDLAVGRGARLYRRLPAGCAAAASLSALQAFLELIDKLGREIAALELHEQVDHVIQMSGLIEHFKKEKGERGEGRIENLLELVSAARGFSPESTGEGDAELGPLESFLSHAVLESGEGQADAWDDCVQMMTLHTAKGLEFPVVFLAGMEDGLFPHQRSIQDLSSLEEERRLCYVGATRAMRQPVYYLCGAAPPLRNRHLRTALALHRRTADRTHRGSPAAPAGLETGRPSGRKLVEDSPQTAMRMGSRVRHSKFGDGVVLSFEGNGPHARIQVNFERQGTKWLMLSYANLEVV
jgi:DNA helicase II / ATP-dependent DNA helicase PcrA